MTLENILSNLINHLQITIRDLNDDVVAKELGATLHDPQQLPHKEISSLAANAVDLLGDIDILLEPGHTILADHFLGYTNTKCLVAAVDFELADILAQSPLSILDLAKACSANPHRLSQILRPLYNNGIFKFDASTATYSNSHVSEMLRSDHWTQWHNWVQLYGNQFYDIARGIPGSVKAGEKRWGAQVNFDTDDNMFTYFQSQGWVPQLHRTLGAGATAMAPGILADYPWQQVADKKILDIGGGGGALIASLLRGHKSMRGGVYDLHSVIDHTRPFFQKGGQFEDLKDRVLPSDLIGGNFMKWIPSSEIYVMKWVLHDWKDHESLVILKNIRGAITLGEQCRLIVLESILSDGRTGRLSRYGDINMMMTANGQERTELQWRSLAQEAGWHVTGIFPMRGAWVQAIELKP